MLLVWVLATTLGTNVWAQTTTTTASTGETKVGLTLGILDPRDDAASTSRDVVHILGRTSLDAKVTVGGEAARLFSTGVFVRDNVPVQMGRTTLPWSRPRRTDRGLNAS